MIDCYEVYYPSDGDPVVFSHPAELNAFLVHVEMRMDGLEQGEEIRIVYRKYTQEEFDEIERDF